MKSFAEFKRACTVGRKLHTIHHGYQTFPWKQPMDMGVREISIVQSNAIAFRTDRGTDSWLHWPKASMVEVEGVTLKVYEELRENPRRHILTYTLVDLQTR